MRSIRPVFWSQLDTCVKRFPLANRFLQAISREYPVYFVCSGTAGMEYVDALRPLYPRATFLQCKNNCDNEKAQLLYDLLRHSDDWDVLVRTCCDSLIIDVKKLVAILSEKMLWKKDGHSEIAVRHAVIGNPVYMEGKLYYIRGGGNATARSVIERIKMPTGPGAEIFDVAFFNAATETGAEFITENLFCIGPPVTPGFPICHPNKGKKTRFVNFHQIMQEGEALLAAQTPPSIPPPPEGQ